MPYRVALTGGIGSGKSTVGSLLAERGAVLLDADALAREVVEPGTDGLAAVVLAFGPDILGPTGTLDRQALASLVFTDPDARARLERIVHPLVRRRAAELEAAADPDAVVVHDIPLLVETGRSGDFDAVVVVDAPVDLAVRRVVADRGWDEETVRRRVAAQATREERLAVADHVVSNDGDREALRRQVAELWDALESASAARRHDN